MEQEGNPPGPLPALLVGYTAFALVSSLHQPSTSHCTTLCGGGQTRVGRPTYIYLRWRTPADPPDGSRRSLFEQRRCSPRAEYTEWRRGMAHPHRSSNVAGRCRRQFHESRARLRVSRTGREVHCLFPTANKATRRARTTSGTTQSWTDSWAFAGTNVHSIQGKTRRTAQ